jgi:subtilisin family serine protease
MVTHLSRRLVIAVGLATVSGGLVGVPSATAAPDSGAVGEVRMAADPAKAMPNSFIVVLKDDGKTGVQAAAGIAAKHGVSAKFTYTAALKGFATQTSLEQARRIAADPAVAYVEQDQIASTQVFVQPNPPSWGLDRIDERSLPLDMKYHYPNTAPRITAFIIDTGIRFTHQEFGGRAVLGIDTVGDGQNGNDCHGHGTHVAGTVGGRSVGVAKQVRLVAVRVLNCAGSGSFAGIIAGVDWVTTQALTTRILGVANMSLGALGTSVALETAVTNSIAANVHYSIAAGNSNTDACNFTPARTPRATTLGATDITDTRAAFSNFGTCVDLFGPGVAIYSAWASADNAYNTISGTSMASPHAAGTAALWRQRFPADNADQVAAALVANATPGVVTNPGAGSPNLLLFMGMIPM